MVANSAAFRTVVALLDRTGGERANLLRVLTYHRVDDPQARPWLDPVLISAAPEVFEVQMKYLSANYQPVSVFDVLEAVERNDQVILPPRAVLVTFDDAYQDFEQHAWPVLKHYQIPVTLFVPTAFPDHPEHFFWWDRLFHALHATMKASARPEPHGPLDRAAWFPHCGLNRPASSDRGASGCLPGTPEE